MSTRLRIPLLFWIVCAGVFLFLNQAEAAKPLAKMTSFRGEVVILSDGQFTKVSKTGLVLNEGDNVQTKDGQAEVTFEDGSVMKLSPFTSAMIQEREEESGWLFKTKTTARRLTVFVGKLWFKSGASHKKNILQTPTAVCGLRGSESEIGFDNVKSFLNIITGGSDTIGEFVRGVFENPGIDAATKNTLYQSLLAAGQAYDRAQQTGTTQDKAAAELKGLEAVKAAAEALKDNPDDAVKSRALQTLNEVNRLINEKSTTTGTSVVGESTTVEELTTTAETPTTTVTIPVTTTTRGEESTTTTTEPASQSVP